MLGGIEFSYGFIGSALRRALIINIIPNWHPIFVHYTVALLSISAMLFVVGFLFPHFKSKNQLLTVARWNLWIGTMIMMITIAAGLQAYNTVAHDTVSHVAMTNHRNWAMPTAILFLILALWQARHDSTKNIDVIFAVSITIAALLLIATAYKGGELVYRYGLGVISLPKPVDDHGHFGDKAGIHRKKIGRDVNEQQGLSEKNKNIKILETPDVMKHKTENNHHEGHEH